MSEEGRGANGDSGRLKWLAAVAHQSQSTRSAWDYNPVHCDARYAEIRRFKAPIAHGLLVTEIVGQISWLASGMSFEVKRPASAADQITYRRIIVHINERGHAKPKSGFSTHRESRCWR